MPQGSGRDPLPVNSFVNNLDEEMEGILFKINCVAFKTATEKGMEKEHKNMYITQNTSA